MSRSRRFFEPNDDRAYRGPSDEMLAVDAASELRSMTLLYERWADRIYRYFLLSTADQAVAERMMRDLISQLPNDLQRFAGEDRSFAGWLFGRASEVFWREYSLASRVYRRVSRFLPARAGGTIESEQPADSVSSVPGFEEMSEALRSLTPERREVLGIHIGAALATAPAAEALKLPASLMSSHVQWAMESLAEPLGATNTKRLTQELSELTNQQNLDSQQRQNHFALIHGLFLGEGEPEPIDEQRPPIFEIAALVGVVVLGLVGIWVWGLITEGDTAEHDVASDPPAEMASQPEPTATPTVEPEPTPEPTPDALVANANAEEFATCLASEGQDHFNRFVEQFNNGDFDTLAEMLPGNNQALDPIPGGSDDASDVPDVFMTHDGVELDDSAEALTFLEARYDEGERWDVLQAYPGEYDRDRQELIPQEMYQDWKQENPGLSMIIIAALDWSGDETQAALAQGHAVMDCDAGRLVTWELQAFEEQNPAPVSVADFMEVMESLESGEIRETRARVRADARPDGGLLTTWELIWTEAILDDDTSVQRIDVRTLDGEDVITYIDDGDQWGLEQRGWTIYGDDEEPELPDEIGLPMEWLPELPTLIAESGFDVGSTDSAILTEDVSDSDVGGVERQFNVEVEDGQLGTVTLLESTSNGEVALPEIHILSASRDDSVDVAFFQVDATPSEALNYVVPADAPPQLELLDVVVESDPMLETYHIGWNDVEMELMVRPSRGGLDVESIPPSLDASWTNVVDEYAFGELVWAYRQLAGYPTDAVWDDGRYRFTIAVDRSAVSANDNWNLQELILLVNALSGDGNE